MDQFIDLESIDTVLATARSVRKNLDFERPVEPEVLLECIDLLKLGQALIAVHVCAHLPVADAVSGVGEGT